MSCWRSRARLILALLKPLENCRAAELMVQRGTKSSCDAAKTAKELVMEKISIKRVSASSIKIDANVRCQRIYPVEDKKHASKKIADLKTVGIKLSQAQAIHLARVLLAASQEWEEIDITAWCVYKRQTDNTYNVAVT